jgi:hypothetical protein
MGGKRRPRMSVGVEYNRRKTKVTDIGRKVGVEKDIGLKAIGQAFQATMREVNTYPC